MLEPSEHDFDTALGARAEEVLALLGEHVVAGAIEDVSIGDAAGRVLAETVVAGADYPPFTRALVDGYAVRAGEIPASMTRLPLAGLLRAGAADGGELPRGQCVQINTGAPVPAGADAVVMVETTKADGDGHVLFQKAATAGEGFETRASLRRRGDAVVIAPRRIGSGELAAIVAAGCGSVRVYRSPRVAVLTTGDELSAPGDTPGTGQIADSNGPALMQLVRERGGQPISLGRSPDEDQPLRAKLREGLSTDLLIVSGGMSKGTHDRVPALLTEAGVNWLVNSLNLKPGKPTRLGRSPNGGWVVGLPGNPVSCIVCYLLFARAIIDGLQGLPITKPRTIRGRTDQRIGRNGERPMYQPARWHVDADGELRVTPVAWRGSGDPFGLAAANALLYRPEQSPALEAGDVASFVPLGLPE